ncbi:hypothetical protein [Fictibacillus enclensis]|nr:hypothetical protein [Fictibacillus enclensis]
MISGSGRPLSAGCAVSLTGVNAYFAGVNAYFTGVNAYFAGVYA